MDNFSTMQGVVLVSHRPMLLEESSCLLLVEQNEVFYWTSNLQVCKRCWWNKGINARSKVNVYFRLIVSQYNSESSRSDTWYPPVSKSCVPSREIISSLISIVPSWLEENGFGAAWLFKKSCLWNSNKLQPAEGTSWVFVVFFGRNLLNSVWLNLV